MTHLLDTDTCIALLRGVPGVLEIAARQVPDDLALSSITRYELLFGAARCPEARREIETVKVNRFLETLHEIPFDSEAADLAARLRAGLEAKGSPIGPMDLLIAATARANHLILVSGNQKEFKRIPKLKLESWM